MGKLPLWIKSQLEQEPLNMEAKPLQDSNK
jgi:hypothetical protein